MEEKFENSKIDEEEKELLELYGKSADDIIKMDIIYNRVKDVKKSETIFNVLKNDEKDDENTKNK